jgi:hypothetical protein
MDNNNVTMAETPISKKKGITGSTLKLIAIIVMLIDHTAATILDRTLLARGMGQLDPADAQAAMDFMRENAGIYALNGIMRLIGRIAFPIFCFLLVEGFRHTHNKWKYTIRLGIFAIVSEIPFDLAFKNQVFDFTYQNVFFTLLIGLLVLMGFELVKEKFGDKKWLPALALVGAIALSGAITYTIDGVIQFFNNIFTQLEMGIVGINNNTATLIIIGIIVLILTLLIYFVMAKKSSLQKASIRYADLVVLFAGMVLADFLKTDYSAFGILTIAVVYGIRKSNVKAVLGGCITLTVMSIVEATAFFSLIPVSLYNGKRGLNLKYVFYIFYPLHLLILHLICYFMGIV